MATEKKTNSTTGIRRFLATHEMRYIVKEAYGGAMKIKKAFKVALADGEHWVYFNYDTPNVATPTEVSKDLFKTMEEAKARAAEKKAAKEKKKAAEEKEQMKKLQIVTDFFRHLNVWDMEDPENRKDIKDEYKKPVSDIVRIYNRLDVENRQDDSEYASLLEDYIRTGSIRSQARTFHKSQVVQVRYGDTSAVEVELSNGTKITPANWNVTRLIRFVFGNTGYWFCPNVKFPKDGRDKVVEQ